MKTDLAFHNTQTLELHSVVTEFNCFYVHFLAPDPSLVLII